MFARSKCKKDEGILRALDVVDQEAEFIGKRWRPFLFKLCLVRSHFYHWELSHYRVYLIGALVLEGPLRLGQEAEEPC